MTTHGLYGTVIYLLLDSWYAAPSVALRSGHQNVAVLDKLPCRGGKIGEDKQMEILGGEQWKDKALRVDGNELNGVLNVAANSAHVQSDKNHGEASVVAPSNDMPSFLYGICTINGNVPISANCNGTATIQPSEGPGPHVQQEA